MMTIFTMAFAAVMFSGMVLCMVINKAGTSVITKGFFCCAR